MKRIKLLLMFILLVPALGMGADEKYNVLFIAVDDMRPELAAAI